LQIRKIILTFAVQLKTIKTMKAVELREQLGECRNNTIKAIKDLMDKYDCTSLSVEKDYDNPIIIEDMESSVYTYVLTNLYQKNDILYVGCSNFDGDDEGLRLSVVNTDLLIELLEWLEDNEEKLFKEC
jgi:hypothetical protein